MRTSEVETRWRMGCSFLSFHKFDDFEMYFHGISILGASGLATIMRMPHPSFFAWVGACITCKRDLRTCDKWLGGRITEEEEVVVVSLHASHPAYGLEKLFDKVGGHEQGQDLFDGIGPSFCGSKAG